MKYFIILILISCSKSSNDRFSGSDVKDVENKIFSLDTKWIMNRKTLKEVKDFLAKLKQEDKNYPQSMNINKKGLVDLICSLYKSDKNDIAVVNKSIPALKYSNVQIESESPAIIAELLKYFLVLSEEKNDFVNLAKILGFQATYDFECDGINLEEQYMNNQVFYAQFFDLRLINHVSENKTALTRVRDSCQRESMKTPIGIQTCNKMIHILKNFLAAKDV